MIPEHVTAMTKQILAAPSDTAILDLIETGLAREKERRTGMKLSRTSGGTILILEQEPRSSRAGPLTMAMFVKIPEITPVKMPSNIQARDGGLHAPGVVKAFMIASLLDWYADVQERYLLSSIKLVFYEWHENALSALDQFAAKFPVDRTIAWFMEPTNMLTCPLENGFGALSINFPAASTSDPSRADLLVELAEAITDHFKPSHPMYPLDPKNYLSHRFLPGAESAIASLTRNRGEIRIAIAHHPLSDEFIENLVEFINAKSSDLGIGENFRVTTKYHYAGAKFKASAPLFKQFIDVHKKLLGKEPYLDWHVHPSMASCMYKHHPDVAGLVFGPGDPFFLNGDQEAITSNDASQIRDILDSIENELLFKV